MCLSIMVTVTEEPNELYALHFEGEEVVMVKLLRHQRMKRIYSC